eukprot:1661308-Pyramimonas_sp.AAC.1
MARCYQMFRAGAVAQPRTARARATTERGRIPHPRPFVPGVGRLPHGWPPTPGKAAYPRVGRRLRRARCLVGCSRASPRLFLHPAPTSVSVTLLLGA